MSLLNIAVDVFHNLFTQWLSLRDQNRVERAAGRMLFHTPVISVCIQENRDIWSLSSVANTFTLESELVVKSIKLIAGAENRTQCRRESAKATLDQIEAMLKWAADRTKSVMLSHVTDDNMREILSAVSKYCSKLDTLNFVLCAPWASAMQTILQNTQQSLRTLLIRSAIPTAAVVDDSEEYTLPQLQIVRVSLPQCPNGLHTGVASLLSKCPNITALSIRGGDSTAIGQPMADTLVQLQRLELFRVSGVADEHMLQVFTNCPQMNFLDVWKCPQISSHCMDAAVQTLPCLHTLVSDVIDDAVLMRLAAVRALALRALYAGVQSGVSYAAIRAVTAAHPQLTSLGMYNVAHSSVENIHTMFEHCAALQQLDLCASDEAVMNAALESVALHCSQLERLNLQHCQDCDLSVLSSMWAKCTQLRHVAAASKLAFFVPHPIDDRGWSITNAYTPFARWMPNIENIRHDQN